MTEITFKITVQVDPNELGKEFPLVDLQNSAMEAIDEALNHAANRGFNHPLADEVSVGIAGVELENGEPLSGRFVLSNDLDPNDSSELVAQTWDEAYTEALEILGWNVLHYDED